MSRKILDKLHDIGFQREKPLFQQAVFETALRKNLIAFDPVLEMFIEVGAPPGKQILMGLLT